MDSDKILQDLNRRFVAPLPEFYKRRIIVWYDEDKEFQEQIGDFEIDNAKVIIITGSNYFEVKKTICVDDTMSNILLYNPMSYDRPDDNWLYDIELYSEEFRADMTAMWMDEMGLESTPAMRQQIKVFKKFFNAKERRDKISRLEKTPANAAQLNIAVMSALAGLKDSNPSEILANVICEGTDMEKNAAYQEFAKYGADRAFWEMASQGTGYVSGEVSLEGLFKHILLSAFVCNYSKSVPNDWYCPGTDKTKAFCYELVSDIIRSDKEVKYIVLAKKVEDDLNVIDYFMNQPIEDLLGVDCFPCANEVILYKLMTAISNDIIDVDKIRKVVDKRRVCAMYSDYASIYEGLRQLSNMQEFYLNHAGGFHLAKARDIWKAYTDDYYKMDQHYRLLHREYEHYLLHFNQTLNDLYSNVIDQAEKLYNTWFLTGLGGNWTNICSDELSQVGHIDGVDQQIDFYQKYVRGADNRIFVVISDAMRYEVAAELEKELEVRQQSQVKITSQQAIFPTITKFGMAALLPHRNLNLDVTPNNIKVLADDNQTDSQYRESVLKKANPDSCVLKYTDIIAMKSADRSELVKGMKVVYIYHDTIDEASHKSDTEVFDACSKTVDQLKNLVDIMVKDFKALNILITADHGFLYTYSPLQESSKLEKSDFMTRILEYGRRFALMKKGEDPDYLMPVKMQTSEADVAGYAPKENVRIKASGGMKFVHGGTSLQEMVVPIIDYRFVNAGTKEYMKNKDKYDTKPVEVSVLVSKNHMICNRSFALDFYQNQAVSATRSAAEYYVYFVDEMNNVVSDMPKIIADKTTDNGQDRVFRVQFSLKSIEFIPNHSYYLVISNNDGIEVSREEFEVAVASNDKKASDENKIDYFS